MITFKKDEFGIYGVYQNNSYIGLVIDKTPKNRWEVYSTLPIDKGNPVKAEFRTLTQCKEYVLKLFS